MKKKISLFYLLILVLCLTSCKPIYTVYKVYVNSEYNLRVLQYQENSSSVSVDEYYYTSDIYSGHIEINITIPDEIDGMKINEIGRLNSYQIGENPQYPHDEARAYGGKPAGLAIICNSYFEEGTTFDININIEANIYNLE